MRAAKAIVLKVNGVEVSVDVNEKTQLIDALRQDFNCKGVRFGCGAGRCGACMVLVDGRPLQSCSTPLWSVAGKDVTTIEGVAQAPLLSRVRELFITHQAAQCGYCINGLIVTLAAIFASKPLPSRGDILAMLDERHICRCGTHVRILRVVDQLLADFRGAKE